MDDSSSSSSEDEDEERQAPVPAATTSGASESTTTAAATTSDDCCEVCLVAPRAGFALVPCGHARFCEACAMRVSVTDGGNLSIDQSINHYFIVRPNVEQRGGQLSLPHTGIAERNWTENLNSMSSSYNTPCSKHKLVVSIYSNTEISHAMSTLDIWCSVVRSRDFNAPIDWLIVLKSRFHPSPFPESGIVCWRSSAIYTGVDAFKPMTTLTQLTEACRWLKRHTLTRVYELNCPRSYVKLVLSRNQLLNSI